MKTGLGIVGRSSVYLGVEPLVPSIVDLNYLLWQQPLPFLPLYEFVHMLSIHVIV